VELRQLVQFAAVAESKSFRRAAARLHMSQPPLSQAIRRLEREMGVKLFDRTSRSVEITLAGKAFLAESQRILAELDAAILLTQRTSKGLSGRLRIAFTVPWAYEVVPDILRTFRAQCPSVVLSLRELSSSAQVRALLRSEADVGFLRVGGGKKIKDIETLSLLHDRLVLVTPRDHPLASAKSITIDALKSEPFIVPPLPLDLDLVDFSYRAQVLRICSEAGFFPTVGQEAGQIQTIVQLVEAGMGISLVPERAQRHFSANVAYRALDFAEGLCQLSLAVAWNPGNRSPVLTRFIESMRT
jgi:DNA-binding transcriptional LysR family regulator